MKNIESIISKIRNNIIIAILIPMIVAIGSGLIIHKVTQDDDYDWSNPRGVDLSTLMSMEDFKKLEGLTKEEVIEKMGNPSSIQEINMLEYRSYIWTYEYVTIDSLTGEPNDHSYVVFDPDTATRITFSNY